MAVHRTPWGDFPNVLPHTQVSALESHVDYAAARAGDMAAARRLVSALYRPRASGRQANFVVPVVSFDGEKRMNAIPLAFGERVALELKAQLVPTIVQDNYSLSSPATGIRQITHQPSFTGIAPLGSYVIVDDILRFGASVANLRGHITQQGGTVTHAAALATTLFAAQLAPEESVVRDLHKRFQHELEEIPSRLGFPAECLTSREAVFFLGLRNLEALRNPAAPLHRVVRPEQ